MNQVLAILLVVFMVAHAFEEPDLDALAEFCGKESNRKYCDQLAQLAIQNALEVSQEQKLQMEKRKPSFVRFGKRSGYPLIIDNEEMRMDKRKPSFVRFGRK